MEDNIILFCMLALLFILVIVQQVKSWAIANQTREEIDDLKQRAETERLHRQDIFGMIRDIERRTSRPQSTSNMDNIVADIDNNFNIVTNGFKSVDERLLGIERDLKLIKEI